MKLVTLFSNWIVMLRGYAFWPALCSLTGGLMLLWHTFLYLVGPSQQNVTKHTPFTSDTLLSLPAHVPLSIT